MPMAQQAGANEALRRRIVTGPRSIDGFCIQRYVPHTPNPLTIVWIFLFLLIVRLIQAVIKPG